MKKLVKGIKKVGFVANTEKANAQALVAKAIKLVGQTGRKLYCDAGTFSLGGLSCEVFPDTVSLASAVDLILVFGGDGTFLRVAREAAGVPTPLLGINIGSLGFLTAVSSAGMAPALKRVWDGEFTLESRHLIEAEGACQKKPIKALALNDFVISRGIDSRLITLEVCVDDEFLTRYRCDGLIVSSPTGSTAYSLSAGGAIIHPQAAVMQLTPICPHTLTNQSVIVSLDSAIKVKVITPRPATIFNADAVRISDMFAGDEVTIRRSRKNVTLMRLQGTSFFDTLRRKLHWSGANV